MQARVVPDVVRSQVLHFVPGSISAREAAKVMRNNHVAAVMVGSETRLAGIITERDLTQRVLALDKDPDDTQVREIMTPNPKTIGPDESPDRAIQMMREGHFRHLPVKDAEGKITGMVSMRDLYSFINTQLGREVENLDAFIFNSGYSTGH